MTQTWNTTASTMFHRRTARVGLFEPVGGKSEQSGDGSATSTWLAKVYVMGTRIPKVPVHVLGRDLGHRDKDKEQGVVALVRFVPQHDGRSGKAARGNDTGGDDDRALLRWRLR